MRLSQSRFIFQPACAMQAPAPEQYLKGQLGNGGVVSLQAALREQIANLAVFGAFAAVVAVAVVLVYVHPRSLRTHHSFAVDEYLVNELHPEVVKALEAILFLRDFPPTRGRGTYTLTVGAASAVEATRVSDADPATVESHMYATLLHRLPSLRDVTAATLARYSATVLERELVSAVSTSTALSPESRVLQEAAAAGGGACDAVAASYTGLALLLSEADVRKLQTDALNVGLLGKVRRYVTTLGAAPKDPALSHIGACVADRAGGAVAHGSTARTLSRALCAATDLASLSANVLPQVRTLFAARRPLSIVGVFWLFYTPYYTRWLEALRGFVAQVTGIVRSPVAQRIRAGLNAHVASVRRYVFQGEAFAQESNVDLLKGAVADVVRGRESTVYLGADGNLHRSEGFFKAIGRALKAFAKIPELLVLLLSALPKIFTGAITMITTVLKYVPLMFRAIVQTLALLTKNPVLFVVRILTIVLGTLYLVVLAVAGGVLSVALAYVYAVTVALPMLLLDTAVAGTVWVLCLASAVCDQFTNGMLRILARTENHPEAWWYNAGFEGANVNMRFLASFSTCTSGYTPKFAMCVRNGACTSASCPAAMLMRAYRTGKYRHAFSLLTGQPLLPGASNGCAPAAKRYAARCASALFSGTTSINSVRLKGGAIRDMVRALCLARNHLLPGTDAERTALARHALQGDALGPMIVGIVTADTARDARPRVNASTRLCVAAVAVVVLGIGLAYGGRIRALRGSLSTD
jgi:hypothetical protein